MYKGSIRGAGRGSKSSRGRGKTRSRYICRDRAEVGLGMIGYGLAVGA